MTFCSVSPSVYVVFPLIAATNDCGLVGNAYTSWTLGVPEHQLSTYQRGLGTSAFNPADLGCPGPDPHLDGDQYGLEDAANQGAPSVLLPGDLTALDPAWKSCVLGGLGLGRDPPRALQPASNMAPKATGHDPTPIKTQSVAFAQSTPKPPGPDPTRSSQPTRTEFSLNLEDSTKVAVEHVQEPSSVCLLPPRAQKSKPAESPLSQPAAARIRPRENALDLLMSDIGNEWSVAANPPPAPSNPYLALPKFRSAKRSYTSSLPVTQSLNSTIRFTGPIASTPAAAVTQSLSSTIYYSTDPVNSIPATEQSPIRPSKTSAGDTSRPDISSTKVPATSAPTSMPHSAPSHTKVADNGDLPYEPCGQGNLEVAVSTTRDALLLSSTQSKSASFASWTVTSDFGRSTISMKYLTGESDPGGSSGSASKLQSIRTIVQISSKIVTIEGSSSSSIAAATETTSLAVTTASTHTAMGCSIHVAGSEGLWIAFLGFLFCFSLI